MCTGEWTGTQQKEVNSDLWDADDVAFESHHICHLKVDCFHLQGQQVTKGVTEFTALQSRVRGSFSY